MSSVARRVEPPAYRLVPDAPDYGTGDDVADLCEMIGFGPDEEQRDILRAIFAEREPDRSAAFEVAVCCPRQNLKTGVFKQAAIGWLFVTRQRLTVWSAHEFATSAEAFRDIANLIENAPFLASEIKQIYRGHGDEKIELHGDRRLVFRTRTRGGGRGLTGDKVVLDEAMFLRPDQMGALLPTLSARPDPQIVYGGSAGLADSIVWRGVRDRGRAGAPGRLGYFEWCDDLPGECEAPSCMHRLGTPGCRWDDRRRWRRANPAIGRRISEEHIAAERDALDAHEFGRERLGIWDDPDEDLENLLADWQDCADARSGSAELPIFGLDVSPGSRSGAIVAVKTREDGLPHVEVVNHEAGVLWIKERAADLQAKHTPIEWVLDPSGPAGALLPDLAEVGIVPRQVVGREMGQACEAMIGLVQSRKLRHLGGPALSSAIMGSIRADIGDGLWKWSRRRSGADICPLVAATAALWAHALRSGTGLFFATTR